MPINYKQFKDLIIIPSLEHLGLYSESSVNLLSGIVAQESHVATYIKQINGPAIGPYQMEKPTYSTNMEYLIYRNDDLTDKVINLTLKEIPHFESMAGNFYFATAMARVHFLRFEEPLPPAYDIRALAIYWKKYYNTEAGKGTVEEFIKNYECYIK